MSKLRILNTSKTVALPDEASGVVQTAAFDFLGEVDGSRVVPIEYEASWPLISSANLANGATITLSVEHSADNSTWAVLYPSIKVLTGATAGLAAGTVQFAAPAFSASRYVRVKATADDTSALDASAITLTVSEYQ